MSASLFDTPSERERSRPGLCLAFSVALHTALLGWAGAGTPERVARRSPQPIPVTLLRVSPVEKIAPVEVPPAPPPAPPVEAKRVPAKAAPRPAPRPRAAPPLVTTDEATDQAQSAPQVAPQKKDETTTAAIAPPPRVYGPAEVERAAAPTRVIRPDYPPRERRRGREGSVLLRLHIDANGEIKTIEITESAGDAFDAAALTALREAQFSPALVEGKPVASMLLYRLRFALR